jgi:hypothetical protein
MSSSDCTEVGKRASASSRTDANAAGAIVSVSGRCMPTTLSMGTARSEA